MLIPEASAKKRACAQVGNCCEIASLLSIIHFFPCLFLTFGMTSRMDSLFSCFDLSTVVNAHATLQQPAIIIDSTSSH